MILSDGKVATYVHRHELAALLPGATPAMPRKLRFIPEEGTLVEVTCRTIQSRMLLRPSPGLNEILLFGAAIAFVGGVASWALVRNRDMVPFGPPATEAPGEAAAEPVAAA